MTDLGYDATALRRNKQRPSAAFLPEMPLFVRRDTRAGESNSKLNLQSTTSPVTQAQVPDTLQRQCECGGLGSIGSALERQEEY